MVQLYKFTNSLYEYGLLQHAEFPYRRLRISFLPFLFFLMAFSITSSAQTNTPSVKEDNYGLRGMPPCPFPRTFEQPDGSSFQGKVVGNMQLFYVETVDGFTVLKDESDGFLKYAVTGTDGDLFLTNMKVSDMDKRTEPEKQLLDHISAHARYEGAALAQKKLKPTGAGGPQFIFPSTGIRKALMILVSFPDQAPTYTTANVDSLLNETGYNVNGQSGSFRDYYLAASYGLLTINSDVMGWYTAPFNKSTYGYSNGFTAAVPLIRMAVDSAEAHGVNFAQYDGDGDGSVDVVMVLHSGRGAEESGNNSDIWSHRWVLAGASLQVSYDGKWINDYIIQPEKYGSTNITNIGVICHEFGHALGLPDLYDTDYTSSGLGNWCLMSGGSWNNSGKTPPHMSAWCKQELGWATPITLSGSGKITALKSLNDTAKTYRINTSNSQEYFLIENRQLTGWDAYLPGSGLCIYHVDESQTDNTDENNYWVGLVQADGLNQLNSGTNGGNTGDPFPGSTNNHTFSCSSTPNSNLYSGASSNVVVDTIAINSGLASFSYRPCTPPPANDSCQNAIALTLNATSITATTAAATDDALPSISCGTPGVGAYNGVWFKFTAPYTGSFTFSTCPSGSNDIYARVYTGTCNSFTSCAGTGDDDCGSSPEFNFSGTAGTTYYILVGNYYQNDPTGSFPARVFTPLSITLEKIEATNIGGKRNRITWNSLMEEAGDYYELEKSTDGTVFEKIAKVSANNKPFQYAVIDENGVGGVNYYRLKLNDQGGGSRYSETVSAYVTEKGKWDWAVYPNPASESLTVSIYGTISTGAHIRLMDITGKIIRDVDITGNEYKLDMKNMANGIYLLKYEDDIRTQTIRVTKN